MIRIIKVLQSLPGRAPYASSKAGIINLVDLTDATFVLYRAESDYVQTLSDWLLASLDKYSADGTLDQFIQSIK